MSLAISFHGGLCCGVKHIHGFSYYPDTMVGELKKIPVDDADAYGQHVKSNQRFFHKEAPKETCLERFDRYLEFLAEWRPCGIVECILNSAQQTNWDDILLARGFKPVTTAMNSNSGNKITIYHLIQSSNIETPEDEED